MKTQAWGLLAMAAFAAPAFADVSYISCSTHTTFHKPAAYGTDWEHQENNYTKVFRLDTGARMIYAFNDRNGKYVPICSQHNNACAVSWQDRDIGIDGTRAQDDPTPHLDFRRSIELTDNHRHVHFVIADYGDTDGTAPNMTWTYDGICRPSSEPAAPKNMGPGPGADRPPENPNYQKANGPTMPVSTAERDRVLAPYKGNTMWGFSGGGHWFHMWTFDDGVIFAGDDNDMSSEGHVRQIYIGKDSTGYRMCSQPIPKQGTTGCYPLLDKKVGDHWIEHDMDGDAYFQLLPGRQ